VDEQVEGPGLDLDGSAAPGERPTRRIDLVAAEPEMRP
jgi:hypothetical protein